MSQPPPPSPSPLPPILATTPHEDDSNQVNCNFDSNSRAAVAIMNTSDTDNNTNNITDTDTAIVGSSNCSNNRTPDNSTVTRDDLLELVRAIHFAKADESTVTTAQQVFSEITEVLSLQPGFEYLRHAVQLYEVQEVWDQVTSSTSSSSSTSTTAASVAVPANNHKHNNHNNNADLLARLQLQNQHHPNQPLQLYTIGKERALSSLAQQHDYYSNTAAAAAITTTTAIPEDDLTTCTTTATVTADGNSSDYVHFFCNVPMDRSGSNHHPHEALINFQIVPGSTTTATGSCSSTTTTTTSSTTPVTTTTMKKNRKKGNKKKKQQQAKGKTTANPTAALATNTSTTTTATLDGATTTTTSLVDADGGGGGRIIVKVQRAAPLHEQDTTKYPMLCYNQTRSHKTFLHPDHYNDNADGNNNNSSSISGYDRIVAWMNRAGQEGALGSNGASKVYFYARVTKALAAAAPRKDDNSGNVGSVGQQQQNGPLPDILSIDVSQLVDPFPDW